MVILLLPELLMLLSLDETSKCFWLKVFDAGKHTRDEEKTQVQNSQAHKYRESSVFFLLFNNRPSDPKT